MWKAWAPPSLNFGKEGQRIVILLGGSSKKRQSTAIAAAQDAWAVFKRRRKGREK